MANVPLKTIKFPGLDDTYTFVQNDPTLTVSGAAADAKATGDEISSLKSAFDSIKNAYRHEDATEVTLAWYSDPCAWDYRHTGGSPVSVNGYQAAYAIEVSPGEQYALKNAYRGASQYRVAYVIFNADYSAVIDYAPKTDVSGSYDYDIVIPNNGAYLCINCNSGATSKANETKLYKVTYTYPRMDDVIESISNVSDDVTDLSAGVSASISGLQNTVSELVGVSGDSFIDVSDFTVDNGTSHVTDTENGTITITNTGTGTYNCVQTPDTFIPENLVVGKSYRVYAEAAVVSGTPDIYLAVRGVQGNDNGVAALIPIPTNGIGYVDFVCDAYMKRITLFVAFGSSTKNSVSIISNIWLKNIDNPYVADSPNCFVLGNYENINNLVFEKIDNSTIQITGTASERTRLYSANTLPAGMYCLSVTGIKSGIGIRYGSNFITWDNGEPAEVPDGSHIIIQIDEGTVCDNIVQVAVYAGRYSHPYVQGGKTMDDFVARKTASDVFAQYTGAIIEDNSDAAKWRDALVRQVADETKPILRLIHFTDPHNDVYHMRRIMQYKDTENIDDIICTGDIAASYASASAFNGWNSVYGSENVLVVPGNHDWYADSTYTEYITPADMDANLFSGADQWGVTRPTGASYWYKDYTDNNVRLIGVDSWLVYVDQTAYSNMMTWLANVLDDANSHGYHVLMINHTPPYTEDAVKIDCKFSNKLYDYGCRASAGGMDYQARQLSLPEISGAVETFINAGGHFIGYLFGHIHNDFVGKYANKAKQMFVVLGTANPSVDEWNDVGRTGAGGDLFNIVAVDTNLNMLKLIRVGANKTLEMCERDVLAFNYTTQEVY